MASKQETEVSQVIRRRAGRSMNAILSLVDDVDEDFLHSRLRKTVLDEINELAELSCRLVSSVACDHMAVNEYYLEMLERIEEKLS